MSALGQKRTFAVQNGMSALPPKADNSAIDCQDPLSVLDPSAVTFALDQAGANFLHRVLILSDDQLQTQDSEHRVEGNSAQVADRLRCEDFGAVTTLQPGQVVKCFARYVQAFCPCSQRGM